jgi:hypothetical protein
MVAYLNDFALMMIMALGSCMVLLLVRQPPRPATKPAIRVGGRKHPSQATSSGRSLVHSDHADGVSVGI